MKLFLDTSAVFKLYHQETDSDSVDDLFSNFPVNEVFLSEITKVEFASTAWKKFRVREITREQVNGGRHPILPVERKLTKFCHNDE